MIKCMSLISFVQLELLLILLHLFSRINITIYEFIKNLPQFNRSNYQSARLPFDLFRPYAYLLEEKYRGKTGKHIFCSFN